MDFLWKKSDQNKYYQILCNQYIRKIFKFIKDKDYLFYVDYDEKNDYETTTKYYLHEKKINIKDFRKDKQFKNYKLFPFFDDFEEIRNVDCQNGRRR